MRWPGTALILVVALCGTVRFSLAAQQTVLPAPVAGARVAPGSASSGSLAGPRVSPEFQSYEPRLAHDSTSPRASLMAGGGGSHTIVISTLTLILVVIIIVLLVK